MFNAPKKTYVHLDPFTYVQVHQSPTHHWHCTSKLYVLKLYVSLQSYGHLITFAWYQSPPSTFTFRFHIFFVPIACTCTCTCFMCYNSHVHKQKHIWGTVILYHICLFWNWTVIVFLEPYRYTVLSRESIQAPYRVGSRRARQCMPACQILVASLACSSRQWW